MAAAWLAAALALAGCGGGIYLGYDFGDDDFDGSSPSVSLASNADIAAPGASVQLVAAASDPNGIESVVFYQLDSSGAATLLGADGSAPYQLNVVIPAAGASGNVSYFARATDGFGNRADSQPVTIAIVP